MRVGHFNFEGKRRNSSRSFLVFKLGVNTKLGRVAAFVSKIYSVRRFHPLEF